MGKATYFLDDGEFMERKMEMYLFHLLPSVENEKHKRKTEMQNILHYWVLESTGFLYAWDVVRFPAQDETAQSFDAEFLGGLLLLYFLPGDQAGF